MLRNLTRTCYRFVHLTCQMQTKKSKSHFSTLLFIHFRLLTLPQKKTNSKCCTTALAVYLLLFSASYYLHCPRPASGAHYKRSACIDMDMLQLVGCGSSLLRHGLNFSSVVYYATDQVSKKTVSMY